MFITTGLIWALLCIAGGVAVGVSLEKLLNLKERERIEAEGAELRKKAEAEAEQIRKDAEIEAKNRILEAKVAFEKEMRKERSKLLKRENALLQKEEILDKKVESLQEKEEELARWEKNLQQKEKAAVKAQEEEEARRAAWERKLQDVATMTKEEARQVLIASIEEEARQEAAGKIKWIEEETLRKGREKAQKIIALAIQRYAGEFVAEQTVSVVALPSDDMKGRIIGREGRNIRTLEALTGIDFIVDDTPEAVILSGFNPYRRTIAKLALEQLVKDGRIHPARIEEVVRKVEGEMESRLKEDGEKAAFDLGLHGLHPELLKMVGRLKYRLNEGQNSLQHAVEVGFLCGIMAGEIGISTKMARRAGLLHDIGKCVDHEAEGSHAEVGADYARRYGESPKIVEAIARHHADREERSLLAILLQAADMLSNSRPGARRETLASYIKRLDDLEKIAQSFKGVRRAFALQAGREIRVIVEPRAVTDDGAVLLARDIARKIETQLTYPGQIQVSVLRETRVSEYAR
ncbi:MAG: ribonuclease Y [Deltaproteobacteria bacterium]|nr:MAG: ribonuclease Y [Deltaproteobacteria bacterium]